MYKRIIVPLDGSSLAEQALPYAHLMAVALGAEVELIRCIAPVSPIITDPEHGVYLDKVMVGNFADAAREYLEQASQPLREDGLEVRHSVHEGDPATIILEQMEGDSNALIAMSTRGRSGITRWVMGSVTGKVLQATKNPMLIIRPQQDTKPEGNTPQLTSLIVPLDGSSVAEHILPHAIATAQALELSIFLVRVTPSPSDYYRYMEYPVGHYQDFSGEVDEAALTYLRGLAERLEKEGVASVQYRLLHGQPAVAIIDLAHETPNSLVAMTTHGRSGVGRWILGSVADRIVRHSGNPVLIVRAGQE